MKLKYPKCSNGNCMHNNKYLCKTKGFDEDIICKQGKADVIKKNHGHSKLNYGEESFSENNK